MGSYSRSCIYDKLAPVYGFLFTKSTKQNLDRDYLSTDYLAIVN